MAVGAANYPRSVYTIKNTKTGKIYVGSSCEPDRRFECHMSALRRGRHSVKDMQKDFERYGDCFEFSIVDEMSSPNERDKEFEWMFQLKTYDRSVGYNYQDLQCRGYVRNKGVEIAPVPFDKRPDPDIPPPRNLQRSSKRGDCFTRMSKLLNELSDEALLQAESVLKEFTVEITRRAALLDELQTVAANANVEALEAALKVLKEAT